VFPGSREVKVIEQEDPRISQPDQVMLRMLDVGICPGHAGLHRGGPARLMRDMVLKNQVVLGTVNAGPDAFTSALRNLDAFRRRWPAVVATLIGGRYPPEQAPELILGRPAGIKTVIAFDAP
jgi:hypothetical protein